MKLRRALFVNSKRRSNLPTAVCRSVTAVGHPESTVADSVED